MKPAIKTEWVPHFWTILPEVGIFDTEAERPATTNYSRPTPSESATRLM
jgi:hypothetical protein